ncbi:MAG TPA: hypothetical protein VEX35_05625 [Allosphingosinicella sp.]|nr:hypothetical protein [Allosphingosinicella sp.]
MSASFATRFRYLPAAALLAVGLAAPAQAAGPYYLQLLGRDPGNGATAGNGPGGGWIEIPSVGHGAAAPAAVAAGAGPAQGAAPSDLTGDGFPDLLTKVGPGTLVLSGALAGCRAGDRYRTARLREGANGRVANLEGVTIASCARGSFSLNYTRVRP